MEYEANGIGNIKIARLLPKNLPKPIPANVSLHALRRAVLL